MRTGEQLPKRDRLRNWVAKVGRNAGVGAGLDKYADERARQTAAGFPPGSEMSTYTPYKTGRKYIDTLVRDAGELVAAREADKRRRNDLRLTGEYQTDILTHYAQELESLNKSDREHAERAGRPAPAPRQLQPHQRWTQENWDALSVQEPALTPDELQAEISRRVEGEVSWAVRRGARALATRTLVAAGATAAAAVIFYGSTHETPEHAPTPDVTISQQPSPTITTPY